MTLYKLCSFDDKYIIHTQTKEQPCQKEAPPQIRLGCSVGDQIFTIDSYASNFYQLDASSDSALSGTLTVIYSVPGIERMKVLKDSAGSPVTINLADPNLLVVSGLHFDKIGVRPTTPVVGGTYDLSLTTEADGDSNSV